MSSKRYTEEFKIEAVKQVTECGYSASEVARRLGVVNAHSLYAWIKECLTNRGRFRFGFWIVAR
jgi:transposase-like protein